MQAIAKLQKRRPNMHVVILGADRVAYGMKRKDGKGLKDDMLKKYKFDLDRKHAGAPLAFGSGVHHCLGAALARRELYWCYRTVVERFDEFWLEGQEGYEYEPNLFLRRMKRLELGFRRRG